jgi:hypothetical protein
MRLIRTAGFPPSLRSLLIIGGVAAFLQLGAAPHEPLQSNQSLIGADSTSVIPASPEMSAAAIQQRLQVFDKLPLAFEINQGQADVQVDFLSRSRGYTLFLAPTEVTLSLVLQADGIRPTISNSPASSTPSAAADTELKYAALRMKLVGANPRSTPTTLEERPGKANYFLGNDPAKWQRNVATYTKVGYQDVYPGVDLLYYGNQRGLEFDFVVAPWVDPKGIVLDFEGVEKLELDALGNLSLQVGGQPLLHLHKPFVYQNIDGVRQEIPGGYVLNQHRVSFQISSYDAARPLIIDPVFAYAIRLGGSGDDASYAIAVDAVGNAYITGDTTSTDFPLANPVQRRHRGSTDVFVAKLSADGSRLIYVTYLGGSEADVGYGIAIDAAGNAYIAGDTRSPDFPLANPLQPRIAGAADVFVAKLSADGSTLLYSTYFGGGGGERGLGIAVDSDGNAHVTGYTNSTNFPTANALQAAFAGGNADAFVLKLNATGSAAIYSTYLGGGNDRPDIGTAIAVDSAGNAYVTGFTNSPDFPTVKPLQPFVGPTDAFVAKLDPNGSLVYSTHLGGSADDEAMGIAVDAAGSAYVTGHTESPNFPTTARAFSTRCVAIDASLPIGDICSGGDAFVTKLSPDGSALVYSTYLSGSRFEVGRGIVVDSSGNAHVTGLTSSPDFPRANPLQKDFAGGDFDAFVVKLDPTGSTLVYSTYLGGSSADGGHGIALDSAGNAYITGYTRSLDFPVRSPLQSAAPPSRGVSDVFVVKLTETATSR